MPKVNKLLVRNEQFGGEVDTRINEITLGQWTAPPHGMHWYNIELSRNILANIPAAHVQPLGTHTLGIGPPTVVIPVREIGPVIQASYWVTEVSTFGGTLQSSRAFFGQMKDQLPTIGQLPDITFSYTAQRRNPILGNTNLDAVAAQSVLADNIHDDIMSLKSERGWDQRQPSEPRKEQQWGKIKGNRNIVNGFLISD